MVSDGQAEVERFYQAVILAYRSIRDGGGAADAVWVSPGQWERLTADICAHVVHRSVADKLLPTMFAGLTLDFDHEQKEDFILV